MTRQFWAQRRDDKLGPYKRRREAVEAFRYKFPPPLEWSPLTGFYHLVKDDFHTGYGSDGAWFDIQFHRVDKWF